MATTFPGTIPSIPTHFSSISSLHLQNEAQAKTHRANGHRVSFALENPSQASSSGYSLSGHYGDAAPAIHQTSSKAPGHKRKTVGSVTSHVAVLGIVRPPSSRHSQPQSTTGAKRTYTRARTMSSYTINDLSTALAKFQNDERVSRALRKAIWLKLGRARSRYIVKSQERSTAWVRDVQNEVGGIGKAIDGLEKRLDGAVETLRDRLSAQKHRLLDGKTSEGTGDERNREHRGTMEYEPSTRRETSKRRILLWLFSPKGSHNKDLCTSEWRWQIMSRVSRNGWSKQIISVRVYARELKTSETNS
ncbi:hypothetical protein DL96DRAFT_1684411 [Flagelloscypha sp. PMI_526]|nr:hypothetical protein DL96DRAFT_1684411 [Flagelloscypha sp. PMI_526]